jgi:hypothetical protein
VLVLRNLGVSLRDGDQEAVDGAGDETDDDGENDEAKDIPLCPGRDFKLSCKVSSAVADRG